MKEPASTERGRLCKLKLSLTSEALAKEAAKAWGEFMKRDYDLTPPAEAFGEGWLPSVVFPFGDPCKV